MNEAVRWAVEESKAVGVARAVLAAIGRRAEGCLARCTNREIMLEVGIARSAYFDCLLELELLRELERQTSRASNYPLRVFHFRKLCECAERASPLPVDCGKRPSQVLAALKTESTDLISRNGGLGSGKKTVESLPRQEGLFAPVLMEAEARDKCEECGGTGFKMVWFTSTDGEERRGAAVCRHARARIAGRWGLAGDTLLWLMAQLGPKKALATFALES